MCGRCTQCVHTVERVLRMACQALLQTVLHMTLQMSL